MNDDKNAQELSRQADVLAFIEVKHQDFVDIDSAVGDVSNFARDVYKDFHRDVEFMAWAFGRLAHKRITASTDTHI